MGGKDPEDTEEDEDSRKRLQQRRHQPRQVGLEIEQRDHRGNRQKCGSRDCRGPGTPSSKSARERPYEESQRNLSQ